METSLNTQILDRAALLFTSVRKNLVAGAALLSKIRAESLYKPSYETFADFVEQECHISLSFASKLCSVYDGYVLEGGVRQEELQEIDHEKLYLALRLPDTFAAKVHKAQLLSRSELKAELAEKDGVDCQHVTTIHICANCHKRV